MTLERFRIEAQAYRRTSLVDVPSGAVLGESRIPAKRRGWVVVAHDGSSALSSAVEELNRNGLATLEVRLDGPAKAKRLVETVAWLKRSVAEAQGLPVGLLGFGAAGSAALEAAAVLGTDLGALVTVNAAPDLAKARLNGVRTFTLLIADEEHAGANRRALQRVRGVARLERADGALEDAARVYGAAWLCGHLGAVDAKAPVRGMLSRLVGSWRMPKLWWGAPSRAAAAFLLAAGAYFASAPDAQALDSQFIAGTGELSVTLLGSDSVSITSSNGNVLVNGANPSSPGGAVSSDSIASINVIGGLTGNKLIDLTGVTTVAFPGVTLVTADAGSGDDTLLGSAFADTLIGGPGNDSIDGGSGGIDRLDGGSDNDTLVASDANGDSLFGGIGSDLAVVPFGCTFSFADGGSDTAGGQDTLRFEGTEGADNIQVTSFGGGFEQIELLGLGGDDTLTNAAGFAASVLVIDGGEGDDSVVGSSTGSFGTISLLGGGGNDTLAAGVALPSLTVLDGGPGDDSLVGGAGNDLMLDEGSGSTTAVGGAGSDTLEVTGDTVSDSIRVDVAGMEEVTIQGNEGNDTIDVASIDANGTSLDLFASGGDGQDSIEVGAITGTSLSIFLFGGDGDDTIAGSFLGDTLEGGSGNDLLFGNDGDDQLSGNQSSPSFEFDGDDTLDGGSGNDTIYGDSGDDLILGGDGNDTLAGGRDNDTVLGGAGDDFLTEVDTITSGNDSLEGGTGNDLFMLKPGSDDIVADSGGIDTLNFSNASLGVRMNLDLKGERQGIDSNDNGLTLFGVFEAWTGSAHDDALELSPLVAPRFVDGGGQDSIDTLTYDAKGFGVIDNDTAGTLTPTSGGFGVVTYVNWETVVLADSFDSDDIDGDSIPNGVDDDDDNDGLKDSKDPDKDGDGWDDDIEIGEGTNPLDPTEFPADSIVGASGVDGDADGIPDEIEDALGEDLDPSTAPGPLSVSKFKGKLKFPPPLAKDTLSFKTRLALPVGFTLDGAHLIVDIGGVVKEFDLDAKGNSSRLVKNDKAKMKLLSAKKQIQDGALLADLTVTLKKQDFSPDLADEGLDGTPSDTPSEHLVMLFVIADGTPFKAVKKVAYKNKSGFSGSFKNNKALKELP